MNNILQHFFPKYMCGRARDKFICNDKGYFDYLGRYDKVKADRGFQKAYVSFQELMLKHCTLGVPPGARIKSQITSSEVKQTKKIANVTIHAERATNRIKSYRILKSLLLITVLHGCDGIIRTCAGLCNLKLLLFKNSATRE